MPEKTPDNVTVESAGSLRMVIATYETANIDDDDFWTSGIKSATDWDFEPSTEGPQDVTVDAYDKSNGRFTFASAANQTGRFVVWCKAY